MTRPALDRNVDYSARRQLLDLALAEIKDQICGRVLEIGGGHAGRRGRFAPPLEQTAAWWYLDHSVVPQPDIQGSVDALPFRDDSFETILCLEVLEYVPDPGLALSELRRVLGDDGVLLVATPFLHRADTEHDYWRFTEPGLRYLLEQAGFEVVSLTSQGGGLGVAVNIFKHLYRCYPQTWTRQFVGAFLWPLLSCLWNRDEAVAAKHPTLGTFSMGYLALAKPLPAASAGKDGGEENA